MTLIVCGATCTASSTESLDVRLDEYSGPYLGGLRAQSMKPRCLTGKVLGLCVSFVFSNANIKSKDENRVDVKFP